MSVEAAPQDDEAMARLSKDVDETGPETIRHLPNTIHPEDALPPSYWEQLGSDSADDGKESTPKVIYMAPTTVHIHRDFLPSGSKSLSGIAIRAFLLGSVFTVSSSSALGLLFIKPHPLWRAPFFLATLSVFHFLEYYITARYNTPFADVAAFLLTHNGAAYNIAHTAAMTECVITSLFFPSWQARFSSPTSVGLGLAAVVIGQTVRSLAMATAGTNFNHTVQTRKRGGHVLVTGGVYAWSRHPSYFGFFWWGLGTQIVLGNVVCLAGYALVLWNFFGSRIARESQPWVNRNKIIAHALQVKRSIWSASLATTTCIIERKQGSGYPSYGKRGPCLWLDNAKAGTVESHIDPTIRLSSHYLSLQPSPMHGILHLLVYFLSRTLIGTKKRTENTPLKI